MIGSKLLLYGGVGRSLFDSQVGVRSNKSYLSQEAV